MKGGDTVTINIGVKVMCSDFEIAGILPLMLLDDLYSSSSEEEIHPTPKRRRRKDNPFQVYTE